MAKVSYIHKELKNVLPQYSLIRDCLIGEVAVKAKGETYLPNPSKNYGTESNARYYDYKNRAVFYNMTRKTLNDLVGSVFRQKVEIKLPTELESMIENVDGSFNSFVQQCKKAVSFTIAYSRAGLLIDFPFTGEFISVAEKNLYKPSIKLYSPFNVINWNTKIVNGNEQLSQVVLTESYVYKDDGFERKEAGLVRVLQLDEDNDCYYRIFKQKEAKEWNGVDGLTGDFEVVSQGRLLDFNGNPLKFIPFTFIGSVNNDYSVDTPFFYDIASLNIAHYRNSADYEEACFVAGQPTVVVTGVSEEWVKNAMGGSVNLGVRGGIPLPKDADAKLIQMQPNNTAFEAMKRKEEQMIMLGAKIAEVNKHKQTATQAEIDNVNQTSLLASIVENVESAYLWAFKQCCLFTNSNADIINLDLSVSLDNLTNVKESKDD